MPYTRLSNRTGDSLSPKLRYLAEVAGELDRLAPPGRATRALFLSEIEHHIEMLHENLAGAPRGTNSEARAVSMMAEPREVARALVRADAAAKASSPSSWLRGNLRAWKQYLQIPATVLLAAVVSTVCMSAALLLVAVVPGNRQETWIVPLVAGAMFVLITLSGWLLEEKPRKPVHPRLCFWASLFALGAQLATMGAETIEAMEFKLAEPAAYGALVLVVSFFTALSFAGMYYGRGRSRTRFFRVSFLATLGFFLTLTLLFRLLTGPHHGILLWLYTLFGIATIFATRRFVSLFVLRNPEEAGRS